MSTITEDLVKGFDELKGWMGEVETRMQPVIGKVEKYADPFITNLAAGLSTAGIVVPVKYVDVALSLVSKLAGLDPEAAAAPAAPAAPADPAAAAAPAAPAESLPAQ